MNKKNSGLYSVAIGNVKFDYENPENDLEFQKLIFLKSDVPHELVFKRSNYKTCTEIFTNEEFNFIDGFFVNEKSGLYFKEEVLTPKNDLKFFSQINNKNTISNFFNSCKAIQEEDLIYKSKMCYLILKKNKKGFFI